MTDPTLHPDLGSLHTSRDPERGFIENDPILRLSTGKTLHGAHGLLNFRAEIGVSAHEAGLLNHSFVQDLLKR